MKDHSLEIIAIVAVLAYCGLFLYTNMTTNADFGGTDTAASSQIAEISGKSPGDYGPLVGQWTPPGSEVESVLFAIQAAVGGILVGWVFGYWAGQKRGAGR